MERDNSSILILITLVLIFLFYFGLSRLDKTNTLDNTNETEEPVGPRYKYDIYKDKSHKELPIKIYNNDRGEYDGTIIEKYEPNTIEYDSPTIRFINDSFDKQVKEFKNHKR